MDAMERLGADVGRLATLFDEHEIRGVAPRTPNADDGVAADAVITAFNSVAEANNVLGAYVYATVSTDTRHERAQGLLSELEVMDSKLSPLVARLAEWVASLGACSRAAHSLVVLPTPCGSCPVRSRSHSSSTG